jgi:hypothetical protein
MLKQLTEYQISVVEVDRYVALLKTIENLGVKDYSYAYNLPY